MELSSDEDAAAAKEECIDVDQCRASCGGENWKRLACPEKTWSIINKVLSCRIRYHYAAADATRMGGGRNGGRNVGRNVGELTAPAFGGKLGQSTA